VDKVRILAFIAVHVTTFEGDLSDKQIFEDKQNESFTYLDYTGLSLEAQ